VTFISYESALLRCQRVLPIVLPRKTILDIVELTLARSTDLVAPVAKKELVLSVATSKLEGNSILFYAVHNRKGFHYRLSLCRQLYYGYNGPQEYVAMENSL
jgi:hypothetical protein